MNEQIEHCLYESGLTADGCWNELDDYAKEAIERFAELIVRECAELCLTHEIADESFGEISYRKGHHFDVIIRKHFGIEHQKSVGKRLMDKYSGALSDLAK